MALISFQHKGDFKETTKFLKNNKELGPKEIAILNEYGKFGVEALAYATPKDSGKTSESWDYEVTLGDGWSKITFLNSNIQDDWFNVAIYLQYGHGTRNGGWVEGRDYINPALRPIFDNIAKEVWDRVVNGVAL